MGIKISELNELIQANDNDIIPIVDIANEATKKITKKNLLKELKEIIAGTILYENENGTTENVTLSQSAEEFDYIEIFYKNNDNFYNSTKIDSPNGKSVNLLVLFINQTGLVFNIASAIVKIENTTISKSFWGNSSTGSSTTNVSTTDMIKITKVIGYKN